MQLYDENLLSKTLEYIKDYQKKYGTSPSYRTIMRAFPMHYTSVSKVDRYLKVLKSRGLIGKESDGSISIGEAFTVGATRAVPLLGNCACGEPMFAEENVEATYSIPVDLLSSGEYFILRAVGNSMVDVGIFDNDMMIVKKQETAENGQIVIALVDGENATAKRFYKQKNKIILHPENSETIDGEPIYTDIVVDNCIIMGIVTNVWHSVR